MKHKYITRNEIRHFSKNGKILPIQEAVIPLSSIEYAYGFGVYEIIRVSSGIIYFLSDHLERLTESAKIIELDHQFSDIFIEKAVLDFISIIDTKSFNIKILLIGGSTANDAQLFVLCFNPLFSDKKLYRDGAGFITCNYERIFPHAKTLNMLSSYLSYRKAKNLGAYDALLIDRDGYITEGTRTNFFCLKDQTIYTPPEKDILLGVTRKAILKVALNNGYKVEEQNIRVVDLANYDGAFISSTSSKIIPIKSIDGQVLKSFPEALKKLMNLFNDFLAQCQGKL